MIKKLTVLVAALALSAPAFADRGHRHGHGHGHGHAPRHVVVHKPHYVVQHRPVVHHPVVVHRPVVQHVYHHPAPRPVYVVERPHYNGVALIAGAIIGAAIVHHATTTSYGY
jgi:hypothetical protein